MTTSDRKWVSVVDSAALAIMAGLPTALALFAIFLIPDVWGHDYGYMVVGAYWLFVMGFGHVYGTAKYFRIRGELSADEKRKYWHGGGARAWAFWPLQLLFFSWPVAIGTFLWLFGLQEPSSWYLYSLVASCWALPLLVTMGWWTVKRR